MAWLLSPSRSDPARANIDPWTTCDSALPNCSNASATCRCGFDLPARERELTEARAQSAAPDLWDDPERAQALMRRVARLEGQVESWRSLERRTTELGDLAELADETEGEERDALTEDIRRELAALEAQFGEIEVSIMLGGPYDDHDAVLAIHAREGGTDAQDWTEILLRMYLRWAERHRYSTQIVSISSGEEAESSPSRSASAATTPTGCCAPSAACIAWCASRPSTPRGRGTRASRSWR